MQLQGTHLTFENAACLDCTHRVTADVCRLAGLLPAAQALSTGPALQRLVALLASSQPDALPAAWFAATALGRAAACQPALGQTAAATDALAALMRLLQGPGSLQQAALAAILQLVICGNQDAHPDRLLQVGSARQALLSLFLFFTLDGVPVSLRRAVQTPVSQLI